MRYVSTRGQADELGFKDVLLAGLASDGGLYVPEEWPVLTPETIRSFAGKSYADVARTVLKPFTGGELSDQELGGMIDEAYGTFHHPAVTPMVQYDSNHWVLELFHGPTLAFKDVAMQLLARMMDHVLEERGKRATVVCATSGDTGGAAAEAFKGRANVNVFVLFPNGRVSNVQQRQMTTLGVDNVHALAIEGDFDNCQAMVKSMFNHQDFRERLQLSGVNSINWGRIMAQVVYYFTSAASLGAPERQVSFCVPSANFGDIFAGFVASKMGIPVEKLIIATNQNDILARALASGRYEVRETRPSMSPSMDIQVSSNFERLLFEASGRDAQSITTQMANLVQSGSFTIDTASLKTIQSGFSAGSCGEAQTLQQIRHSNLEHGYLADPHTAVGLYVAQSHINSETPMITLSTAHPAKFPNAVEKASGIHPDLPVSLQPMMDKPEKFTVLPNDISAVESYIAEHSKASMVS